MSDILVDNDFKNYRNTEYVVKVEDPTGAVFFREKVTIPTSGVFKLVVRKAGDLPRPRSNSLSGNELNLPKNTYRNRSPSLYGNNLGLPNQTGKPSKNTYRNRSPSLYGNNLGLPKGGRKSKTIRHRK